MLSAYLLTARGGPHRAQTGRPIDRHRQSGIADEVRRLKVAVRRRHRRRRHGNRAPVCRCPLPGCCRCSSSRCRWTPCCSATVRRRRPPPPTATTRPGRRRRRVPADGRSSPHPRRRCAGEGRAPPPPPSTPTTGRRAAAVERGSAPGPGRTLHAMTHRDQRAEIDEVGCHAAAVERRRRRRRLTTSESWIARRDLLGRSTVAERRLAASTSLITHDTKCCL